jgi:serine/threonine-protein kinase
LLWKKGRFSEALDTIRRGHGVGSRRPVWPYPSAEWLAKAERLATTDERLSAVLRNEATPENADELLAFGQLCQTFRNRYAAAVRFYSEAFAADPRLPSDPDSGARYNAARAAALAGCGKGQDAFLLDVSERGRLRKQSLAWLRDDLQSWGAALRQNPTKIRPLMLTQMRHCLDDPNFAGVRDAAELAKLPGAERAEWEKLWKEVSAKVSELHGAEAGAVPTRSKP